MNFVDLPNPLGVVPVLIGPLQALMAILPGIAVAMAGVLVSVLKPQVAWALLRLAWRLKVHLLLTAGVVVGLWWLGQHYWPSEKFAGGGKVDVSASFPVFRGDLARRGHLDALPGPSAGGINWKFQDDTWFFASPAIVGNRLYIPSAKLLVTDRENGVGFMYCLDADTGKVIWKVRPKFETGWKQYRATFSSPVVKGRYLVCGEGLHTAKEARVVCFDVSDGRVLWSHQGVSHMECAPVISPVKLPNGTLEDRVFIGAGDNDGYYALDLATGAVRWHAPGSEFPDAETSLVVHDNLVFAGQGNEGKALSVLDAVDGRLIRRMPTGMPVFSPGAIANGRLFVGMGNGDFVNPGPTKAGRMWCLDIKALAGPGDVKPLWQAELPDTVLGAPVAIDDRVYCATGSGEVFCLRQADGAVLGQWNANESIKASPAVTREHVYVVTESGMLYALDRDGMTVAWAYRVGSGEQCFSSPVVRNGQVIVGTRDDGVVSVGRPSPPAKSAWAGPLAGPAKAGNIYTSPIPLTAAFKGNYPAEASGDAGVVPVAAPPALVDGHLWVPLTGQKSAPGLARVPVADLDSLSFVPSIHPIPGGVWLSPGGYDKTVFCVNGRPGDPDRKLRAIAAVGKELWARPVASGVNGAFAVCDRGVLLQDQPGVLSLIGHDGSTRFSRALPGEVAHAPTLWPTLAIVATSKPDAVEVVDLASGGTLWRSSLRASPTAQVLLSQDRVIVPTDAGVVALGLRDGKPVAGFVAPAHASPGQVVQVNSVGAYVDATGQLRVISLLTGKLLDSAPGMLPRSTPLPALTEFLVVSQAKHLVRVPAISTASDRFTVTPWYRDGEALGGSPTTGMLLINGAVYLGWEGWGLLRIAPDTPRP